MNEVIMALQLLAQRNVGDTAAKSQVAFFFQDNQYVVCVQITGQTAVAGTKEYKASGASYLAAADMLIKRLLEPFKTRQVEDAQIVALVAQAFRITGDGTKAVNTSDLPAIR